ncbi:MAG: MFS transporter [Paludibacteraceae bacterium]|nr:MFS transporter [Paludibacteraceae bacterium]
MTAAFLHTNRSPWLWVPTLYFAEGVPYFIVTAISIALFNQLGMPNAQMALFTSLISFPWVIKPIWSPFVDVIRTKRWWIVAMQLMMVATIFLLAWLAPKGYFTIALILFTVTAFASATHDIAADGFYMIALSEPQQSAFVGIRSTFYRIANIFCQSLLLMIVGILEKSHSVSTSWMLTLLGCSVLMTVIALWHLFTMPKVETIQPAKNHAQIWQEIGLTFVEFFRKPAILLAMLFMLLYRLPEALLLKLCVPFFLAPIDEGGLALTMDTVGELYGGLGVIMMLLGGILGGLAGSRWGLKRVMLWMCLCLTLPCIVYCYMAAYQPDNLWLIASCIGIEQLGYGLGYTACMLYMMHFAKGEHKTAHFSICTAVMYLGLMLPGLVAGYIQQSTGYLTFFWIVMVCCIPSILITLIVQKRL